MPEESEAGITNCTRSVLPTILLTEVAVVELPEPAQDEATPMVTLAAGMVPEGKPEPVILTAEVPLAPEPGATPGFEKGGLRVVLVDGDRHGLLNDELLDLLARCVAGGVPIFLSYGNGRFAKRALINEPARPAIAAGDKPLLVETLCSLLDAMAEAVNAEIAAATG